MTNGKNGTHEFLAETLREPPGQYSCCSLPVKITYRIPGTNLTLDLTFIHDELMIQAPDCRHFDAAFIHRKVLQYRSEIDAAARVAYVETMERGAKEEKQDGN